MPRLHHVQLAMPKGHEEDARAFYGAVLGLTEVAKPPDLARRGGLWFESNELRLHLGVEADFRPARKAHPGLLYDDLDPLLARLQAAGVAATTDDGYPGFRRAYIHDPFGNRIEVMQAV